MLFRLVHKQARTGAAQACMDAPEGWIVKITEPVKKREQEEKYHAMIGDIAKQAEYAGRKWNRLDMKRIMIDEFADAMRLAGTPLHHDSRIIPSENGKRIIQLEIHSSEFWVNEAAQFIEFLYSEGAQRNVEWTEPNTTKGETT